MKIFNYIIRKKKTMKKVRQPMDNVCSKIFYMRQKCIRAETYSIKRIYIFAMQNVK